MGHMALDNNEMHVSLNFNKFLFTVDLRELAASKAVLKKQRQ